MLDPLDPVSEPIPFIEERLRHTEERLDEALRLAARAHHDLAKSEERYRILGAALPGVTWTATPGGLVDDIVGLSSAIREHGPSSLGNAWLDMIHTEDRTPTRILWEAALEGGTPYEAQFRVLDADGAYRWQLSRGLPQRDTDGSIMRWIGANIDIDEQHRALEHQQRIAFTLQEASLPRVLPALPDVYLCAYYRPGNAESTIGGDWYDAFVLQDGRLVLTIGDVLGKGLTAAVTMAKIRQAMRAVARILPDPNALLDAADHTVRSDSALLVDIYATAVAGIYDPRTRTFTFASAGHPGPTLRHPDGRVEELSSPGTLLGMRDGDEDATVTIDIPAGSALVFVTDGLLEATRDIDEGVRRIHDAMRSNEIWSAENAAHALVTHVLAGQPASDDVAVLIAEFGSPVN